MSKNTFFLLLLIAEASAEKYKLIIDHYDSTDCSGDSTKTESATLEGESGTKAEERKCQKNSVGGSTDYGKYSCFSGTLTKLEYDTSECTGTPNLLPIIFEQGRCVTVQSKSMKQKVDCDYSELPCFADTTTACRINEPAMTPSAAFGQCFGDEAPTLAERVPMKALAAGDLVLASPTETTRVIVNQHAEADVYSDMVTLEHESGILSLTPDHVVYADGAFKPAGQVGVGALLEPASKVTKISKSAQGIINPQTTSGTILAAGPTGAPVISSALSEWIADLVLGSTYPLSYSLTSAASYLFPNDVQAFYNAHLEQFFAMTSTNLKGLKAAVPAPAALAILAAFDVACVGAFAAWALFSFKGAVALLAVAAIAKSRRVVKA